MKPFNLEKALAGEPVKLRNGLKAFVKYCLPEHYKNVCELQGFVETNDSFASPISWYKTGQSGSSAIMDLDIASMWEEPRPQVTITFPAPLKDIEEGTPCYKVYNGEILSGVFDDMRDFDYSDLEEGVLFATEEDAQAFRNALKEARR